MQINELKWQNSTALQAHLSSLEKTWLFNHDSLTKRLEMLSEDTFSLLVLSQTKQRLRKDECKALNLPFPYQEYVREVILQGYQQPWVYARSIISSMSLENGGESLQNIGTKPLGSILFTKNQFTRSPIEVTLYPSSLLPSDYCSSNLWGRRSIFTGKKQTVLVHEIFLPAFWHKLLEKRLGL